MSLRRQLNESQLSGADGFCGMQEEAPSLGKPVQVLRGYDRTTGSDNRRYGQVSGDHGSKCPTRRRAIGLQIR
jgi:hypothetical protein